MFLFCSRARPFRSPGARSRGVWMWSGTGACGQGSRPWAREAGSAQTRLHPHGCGCVWQARPLRTTTERRQCSPPVHRGSADRTGGDARQCAGRLRQGPEPAGEMRGRSGQKPPRGTPGCWHPLLTCELATWRPAPPLFEPHQPTPTSPHTDARRSRMPSFPRTKGEAWAAADLAQTARRPRRWGDRWRELLAGLRHW